MLEFEQIQQRGFRNAKENGKIVGVQIPVKLTYYRGVYLSQIRPGYVVIDGERFENDRSHGPSAVKHMSRLKWNLSQMPSGQNLNLQSLLLRNRVV